MMLFWKKLASLRLTLVAMTALAVLAVAGTRSPAVDIGLTAIPLGLMSLNLFAAILTNRSFRTQTGLLVFHVGLLLVFMIIGVTVATRFDGHVEVLQDSEFDPAGVVVEQRGRLHHGALDRVTFLQGDIEVKYVRGLVRQQTRSTIEFSDDAGNPRRVTIGDKVGAEISGYRFLATFNKGLALVLRWQDDSGQTEYGAVHFPSYPQYDWKQLATWTTPAGQVLELELELEQPLLRPNASWRFERPDSGYSLKVRAAGELKGSAARGERIVLPGGALGVEDLRLWMAYRIDYYPYLPWMFVAAILAIGGLAAHFRSRYLAATRNTPAAIDEEVSRAHVVGI